MTRYDHIVPFTSFWNSKCLCCILLSYTLWPLQVKSLQNLEMEAWLDLASIYTKLESWHDSNVCLDKAKSISSFSPKCCHVRGKYSQALQNIFMCSIKNLNVRLGSFANTSRKSGSALAIQKKFEFGCIQKKIGLPLKHDRWCRVLVLLVQAILLVLGKILL